MVYINLFDIDKKKTDSFGNLITTKKSTDKIIRCEYNANSDYTYSYIQNSGFVGHNASPSCLSVIVSANAFNINGASIRSNNYTYLPGASVEYQTTCYFSSVTQVNQYIYNGIGQIANSSYLPTDGFFIGQNWDAFSDNSFGIFIYSSGSLSTSIKKSNFNIDKLDGTGPTGITIDISKINTYRIIYHSTVVRFEIYCPQQSMYMPFHIFYFGNTSSTPLINGSYNNIIMCCTSRSFAVGTIGLFTFQSVLNIDGYDHLSNGLIRAIDNTQTGITTEALVLAIRNKTSYASLTNKIPIILKMLTAASDGTKSVVIKLRLNPTTGVLTYNDISTNTSICDYSITSSAISGGRLLLSLPISKISNLNVNLNDLNLQLIPGDVLVVSAVCSGGSSDIAASLTWLELV